jgi:hypothetical protein
MAAAAAKTDDVVKVILLGDSAVGKSKYALHICLKFLQKSVSIREATQSATYIFP